MNYEHIVCRFTPDEKSLLMAIAREKGTNVTEAARWIFKAGFERLTEMTGVETAEAVSAFRQSQRAANR